MGSGLRVWALGYAGFRLRRFGVGDSGFAV